MGGVSGAVAGQENAQDPVPRAHPARNAIPWIFACEEGLAVDCGPWVHTQGLIEAMRSRGHAVGVCLGTYHGGGVLRRVRDLGGVVRRFWTLLSGPQGVVHARLSLFGWLLAILSRLRGWVHVLELNGIVSEELALLEDPRGRLRRAFYLFSERVCCRLSQWVVCVSPGIRDHVVRRYALPSHKVVVVPNGVASIFFEHRDRARARERFGMGIDQLWLCFAGGLYPWHGVDLVVEALAKLPPKADSVHFMIAGDGPEQEALQRRAAELGVSHRIHWIGRVTHEEIPDLLAAADMGCMLFRPVRSIAGAPLKLVEYLTAGLPVLVSDVPGCREAVLETGAGILVDRPSPDSVAEAIARFAEDPGMWRSRAERARAAFGARHSWDQTASQLEDLYGSGNGEA
ncbi:MAG: glycosyltransferase family 4 protein [Planctomycetes bacterium]|nr:glycosyltransferase family 4 protein [Planctomycetota bacterium]